MEKNLLINYGMARRRIGHSLALINNIDELRTAADPQGGKDVCNRVEEYVEAQNVKW